MLRTSIFRKSVELIWNNGHPRIHAFRSALFLASLMVIFEHFYLLEWLDVFMLRVLHAVAHPTTNITHPGSNKVEAKVLVFTIEQELFETEFKFRSPIDRSRLLNYLQKLVQIYDEFKVLAIDYDLSENNVPEEKEAQNKLDNFLLDLSKRPGRKVVLIKHLPIRDQNLCDKKRSWEEKMYKNGILFGDPDLLHYGLLGLVVKYAERENRFPAFPAVVLAAQKAANNDKEADDLPTMRFTCNPSESSSREFGSEAFKPINFFKAADEVKVCPLDELKAFKRCRDSWDYFGTKTDKVDVIFFGGNYERDDVYITPVDEKPGVTLHAYIYYSMIDSLKPNHALAWVIDIVMGFFAGLIFHKIWHLFHTYRQRDRFAPQVFWASCNFMVLILILVILIRWIAARWLAEGIWLNPAPMFIGLYIDSYVATATAAIDKHTSHSGHGSDGFASLSLRGYTVLVPGIPPFRTEGYGRAVQSLTTQHTENSRNLLLRTLFGIPGDHLSPGDLFSYGLLKIAIFWVTIGIAGGILLTSLTTSH